MRRAISLHSVITILSVCARPMLIMPCEIFTRDFVVLLDECVGLHFFNLESTCVCIFFFGERKEG